jgi:hypothetical protein
MESNAKLRPLWTFDEIVTVLGGPSAVGRMTGCTSSAVCNWRSKCGRFPARYYVAMRDELAARGYFGPPALWGQVGLHAVAA